MGSRVPAVGVTIAICSLLVLMSCDQGAQELTGPSPDDSPLADLTGAPRVEINTPESGATVSPGLVRIEGRTRERGNDLLRTDLWIIPEICCLSEIVFTTTREGTWSFDWDTRELYGGRYGIMAVAHDTEGWSTSASVSVTLDAPGRPERPRIVSLVLERDTLVAGESMGGTVTLEYPAIDDSSSVTVRTLPFHPRNVELVPQRIEIPMGDSVGHFTVTALPVAEPDHVPINGVTGIHEGDFGQTDFVWIMPAGVTMDSVLLDPTLVLSGETSQGTARLTGPAPEGGAVVELESSDPEVAMVPPTVTVPAGQTAASFTINTGTVSVGTGVFIRGTYGGVLRSARLIVDRPAAAGGQLSSLTIEPDIVVGGNPAQGTVTLGGAVDGDTEVTLSSTDTSVATVPPSVTVPAGQTSATFTITTLPNNTGEGQFSWISGQAGGVERGASITTTGAPSGPTIASVEIVPATLGGGGPATGFVTFSSPPTDGGQVSLTSSHPDVVQVPSSATWSWSEGVRAFPVTTSPVASNTQVTITATACCGAGGEATGTVTVTTGPPPPPDNVGITRARFRDGILEVRATSTSTTALLTVFIQGSQTGSDIAIMGLRHIGDGRYEGERPWTQAPVPDEVEVRSNLGGSATDRVR
jgi:hypothetical protein